MTDDEKHRIIGQVMTDLADARQHLACLEAKAAKIAKELRSVASWLEGARPLGGLFHERLALPEAVELIVEIDHAKDAVWDLEKRRAELGV